MQSPTIHIVDDDQTFSVALQRLLTAGGYKVRLYQNAGDFLMADIEDRPGCILLDFLMPGPDGLALQKALKAHALNLPIIFISGCGDIPTAVQAIKAGAYDFLPKPVTQSQLFKAINNALALQDEQWAWQQKREAYRLRYQCLTLRETEVFALVVAGKLNKTIAIELNASERTIKAHRAHVMEKMKVNSLAELVQVAVDLGLVETAAAHLSETA